MTAFSRHPVAGPITQGWGVNKTGGVIGDPNGTPIQQLVYKYGNYQPYGHDGIDYGVPIGTPVYAPGPGHIAFAGWGIHMPQAVANEFGFIFGPGGWPSGIITLMRMDVGGLGCYIAHMSRSDFDSRVGARVGPSTLLGLSGVTGRAGGAHAHWSAIKFPVNYSHGLYSRVNPLAYFSTETTTPVVPGAGGSAGTVTKQLLIPGVPGLYLP